MSAHRQRLLALCRLAIAAAESPALYLVETAILWQVSSPAALEAPRAIRDLLRDAVGIDPALRGAAEEALRSMQGGGEGRHGT